MRFWSSASAVLAASLALVAGPGCAGEVDDEAAEGASAVRQPSVEHVAGAFTVDYGLGALAARRLVRIPRDELMDTLPEGARDVARCLESRRDIVRGDTLSGATWAYDERYFVLLTELEEGDGLTDVRMLFVFGEDGTSKFQVLAWEGRRNLRVSYRTPPTC